MFKPIPTAAPVKMHPKDRGVAVCVIRMGLVAIDQKQLTLVCDKGTAALLKGHTAVKDVYGEEAVVALAVSKISVTAFVVSRRNGIKQKFLSGLGRRIKAELIFYVVYGIFHCNSSHDHEDRISKFFDEIYKISASFL